MTTIAEASSTRFGTVQPLANLDKNVPPSIWRRLHVENGVLHRYGDALAALFGGEVVDVVVGVAEKRQEWLDVEEFMRRAVRAGQVLDAAASGAAAPPDETQATPISPYRRGVILEAFDAVRPPNCRVQLPAALSAIQPPDAGQETAPHSETLPEFGGEDQRVVVAAALICEATAGDGYPNAAAAEVLFTVYPEAVGAAAAAVGAQVEFPVQ